LAELLLRDYLRPAGRDEAGQHWTLHGRLDPDDIVDLTLVRTAPDVPWHWLDTLLL
jgi:hypothetical protein